MPRREKDAVRVGGNVWYVCGAGDGQCTSCVAAGGVGGNVWYACGAGDGQCTSCVAAGGVVRVVGGEAGEFEVRKV